MNEEKELAVTTDFYWDDNSYDAFRRFAKLICRFTSKSNSDTVKYTTAMMEASPMGAFKNDMYPNLLRCRTPKWDHKDEADL